MTSVFCVQLLFQTCTSSLSDSMIFFLSFQLSEFSLLSLQLEIFSSFCILFLTNFRKYSQPFPLKPKSLIQLTNRRRLTEIRYLRTLLIFLGQLKKDSALSVDTSVTRVKLQGTPKKLLMENKDLGGWHVLNGNSASSYIIMAFDNSEDSLHVYYLILPPLSVHSNLFHHKHLNMLQKSTFSGSPNQKQGSYIKQFCVTLGITYYKQCKTFIYVES